MIIPRFSNPHSRPRALEPVARSDLFESETHHNSNVDVDLQKELDELIQSNLDADRDVSVRVKKRRKLNSVAEDQPETSVLFRLLSTPHSISLLPPPPPPPVTREPECEDTEAAAETRRRRAEAVAVDAAWVKQESARLPPPFRVGRVQHVQARLDGAPPMMLAHCLQSPRKTRPPVPRWQLQHHPYIDAPILENTDPTGVIPSVEIQVVSETLRKTRKRRRGVMRGDRSRPQATFWWPEAGCGGKSPGYAMGY